MIPTLPTWIEWGRRRGGKLVAGPEPRMCLWCRAPLPPRRFNWCSDEHRHFAWKFVSTWQAVRNFVYHRDSGACRGCGVIIAGRFEVDHINRVVDGGTDDPTNLRLLCPACHVRAGYEQREAQRRLAHADQLSLEATS